jgi:GTPase SAR1 family protein
MGRYAVLVSGPAGSGKSTLCSALIAHANTLGRTIHLVNLDPAAERFSYTPSIDVRELITLEDVMDEMKLGPNGGLVYCFEYLLENLDWLDEQLGGFEDDYLIIDCPGEWSKERNKTRLAILC